MKVRLACPKDLPELLRIYAAAREAMRRSGNPTQWGNNRPSQETLEEDIRLGRLYALEAGEKLGVLKEVLSPSRQQVYVVAGEREILIPAVPEFILETNIEGGYLKVRLIEGM